MVNIILINYNSSLLTIDCVYSVKTSFNECHNEDYHVWIVDNNSSVEERNKLKTLENDPRITIYFSGCNLGFSKANNVILEKLKRNDFVWFLNNDTLINTVLVNRILNNLPSDDEVVYFDMFDFDGNYKGDGIHSINLLHGKVIDAHIYNKFYVEYICGASLLLKYTEKMPVWDESFFLYYEDADYSQQLKKKGYNFIHLEECYFNHKIFGSSTKKKHINRIRQKSQLIFMHKWGYSYCLFFFIRFFYLFFSLNFEGLKILLSCEKELHR